MRCIRTRSPHRVGPGRRPRLLPRGARAAALLLLGFLVPVGALGQAAPAGDSVRIRLIDVDVRAAVQALGAYIDRPIVFGRIGEGRVTIETPGPVDRSSVLALLEGALDTQGLELLDEETLYRIEQAVPPEPDPPQPPPAQVQETGPLRLYVMRLRHARAEDVAATVSALYGRASAFGEIGRRQTTLANELRENLVTPQEEAVQTDTGEGRSAEFRGDVTIVPDAGTNSLLIRASETDYELIAAAVEELDIRPLQVLIEVVIAEVRRDRSLSYGLETILPGYQPFPEDDAELSGSIEGLGLGDLVLGVMKLGGIDLTATLRAAASRGDVTILSRPIVIAANNEPAEFLVGTQRPFVQVQRSLPTDAPARDQVVQFKEVGTRLNVTPTISQDGYVMLQVVQEVNAATAEVAFDAPVISTRTVQTQLLVRDGHTAVLGGLADRQVDVTRRGVPLLSALPLVGGLFGSDEERSTETELFLFLTPRVIRTDEELDDLTRKLPAESRHVGKRLDKTGWLELKQPSPAVPDSVVNAPEGRRRLGWRGGGRR